MSGFFSFSRTKAGSLRKNNAFELQVIFDKSFIINYRSYYIIIVAIFGAKS